MCVWVGVWGVGGSALPKPPFVSVSIIWKIHKMSTDVRPCVFVLLVWVWGVEHTLNYTSVHYPHPLPSPPLPSTIKKEERRKKKCGALNGATIISISHTI